MVRNGKRHTKKAGTDGKRVDGTRIRQTASYQTIQALKHKYPIVHLCQVLEISRASYYKWLNRTPAQYESRDQTLKSLLTDAYDDVAGIYGYRRMTIYLNYYERAQVNRKHVYRLMNEMNLKSVIRKKKVNRKKMKPDYTTDNIIKRDFKANKPMLKLLTDITEFRLTNGQKVYLSAVLDLCTNKIVAHHMDTHCEQSLVTRTFRKIKSKLLKDETIIHTDRGPQYTSHAFRRFIKKNHATQSMSRPGKCIDNGPMENVWGIIKSEKYYLNSYDTVVGQHILVDVCIRQR